MVGLPELTKEHVEHGSLVDALPGLVWTANADGIPEFFNRKWYEYTGLSEQDINDQGWHGAIHPDDLDDFRARWQTILVSGKTGNIEARLRDKDDGYRWFRFQVAPLRDSSGRDVGWCGIGTDIDDIKRVGQDSHVSNADFRSIADSIPALIALLKPTGEVETVNCHTLEYFGATLDEMINWSAGDTVHPDDLERVIETWTHSVVTEEPYDIEQRVRRSDGVYRWFHLRGLPARDNEGRVVRWCVLQTDIDDQKRAEEAIKTSKQNLDQIINAIPVMAWSTGPVGFADFFNQHYLDYTGFSAEQATGWG